MAVEQRVIDDMTCCTVCARLHFLHASCGAYRQCCCLQGGTDFCKQWRSGHTVRCSMAGTVGLTQAWLKGTHVLTLQHLLHGFGNKGSPRQVDARQSPVFCHVVQPIEKTSA